MWGLESRSNMNRAQSDKMIIDTLYKYRSWAEKRHVDILTKNEIYFASPADFNDPFDCGISPDLTFRDRRKDRRILHKTVTSSIRKDPKLDYESEKIKFRKRILAWDWFFALSMLFAAPVFKVGKMEKIVRILSGVLSLVGLIGMPLGKMQVRNIGIIGYGVVAPVVFLLLGIIFGRTQQVPDELI